MNRFADKFNLRPRIQLNAEVKRLDKSGKKWLVTYTSPATQCKDKQEEFDNVVIATGAFGFPRYPEIYATRDQFNGLIIHSAQVRNDEKLFKGKRVLFIGSGSSGADLATIAVKHGANKVYIVPTHTPDKRNVWLVNKMTRKPDGGEQIMSHEFTRHNSIVMSEFYNCAHACGIYSLNKTSKEASEIVPGDGVGVCDLDVFERSVTNGTIEVVTNVVEFQGWLANLYFRIAILKHT